MLHQGRQPAGLQTVPTSTGLWTTIPTMHCLQSGTSLQNCVRSQNECSTIRLVLRACDMSAFETHCIYDYRQSLQPFLRIRLRPRILRDVSVSDTRTTVQGTEISFPVGIAPTAFHCLAWHEGEMATARGEESLGRLALTE